MKKLLAIALSIASITLSQASWASGSFTLSSSTMEGQLTEKQEYNSFGCDGENISPALEWRSAPASTKSFAITVYDPDAPTGSGWWHWLVFNIPESVHSIKEGAGTAGSKSLPTGAIQSVTDYGEKAFGGACPPKGDEPHRYVFTVYALDVEQLEGLGENHPPALVGYFLAEHTIAKASLISYFGRKYYDK